MRLLIIALLICPLFLTAQMQLGWRTDNYAGINSALLNPALPGRTPYAWDVNLGESSLFLANNYGFLENSSISSLIRLRNANDLEVYHRPDLPADLPANQEVLIYDFYENNSYYAEHLTQIMGPSFSFRVAPQTRVGLYTRWRTMFHGNNIDSDLGYYQWNSIPGSQTFTLEAGTLALAAWGELGLNISQGVETSTGNLLIGATVKRLWGQRAAYFSLTRDFDLNKLSDFSGLESLDFEIETGFSQNLTDTDDYSSSPGRGWGVDLGMLYQVDLGDGFYRWEFGFALNDLGGIRFSDSEQHLFNTDNLATTLTDNYNNLTSETIASEAAEQLSQDIFGDGTASQTANEFTLGLPTTLSLQATYRFQEWAKVEAVYLAGIRVGTSSLNRSSVLAIVPRVDRHWWSIAMPVSMYATDQVRLGLSARLGPIFVGTDQLGSFFRQNQLDSGDFYVGLKLFPLGLGGNGNGKARKRKGRRGKGRDVECYKF
ncbi:MAG: DUF5723 family protein [Bacteroidota bacterium]